MNNFIVQSCRTIIIIKLLQT